MTDLALNAGTSAPPADAPPAPAWRDDPPLPPVQGTWIMAAADAHARYSLGAPGR